MEKNNNGKVVAIISLCVAVVALAVDFASYSASLTINSSARVNPGDTFQPNVNFVENSMSCTASGEATVISAGTASGKTWKDASVELVQPGDSVTCKANIENKSTFIAYLKTFNTASAISCTAGTAKQNVDEAFEGIKLTSTHGADTITATIAAAGSNTSTSTSIAADGTQEVTFTVSYEEGSAVADGDFTVNVPQINLGYSTEQ